MKIIVASDHAGRDLGLALVEKLLAEGHDVENMCPKDTRPVDYPDAGAPAAARVAAGEFDKGLLVCGTGLGMAMAANKVPGIRAAACTNEYLAEMARRHNDANVLCLGGRVTGIDLAVNVLKTFLKTEFEGGRHARRVGKVDKLDGRPPAGGPAARPE